MISCNLLPLFFNESLLPIRSYDKSFLVRLFSVAVVTQRLQVVEPIEPLNCLGFVVRSSMKRLNMVDIKRALQCVEAHGALVLFPRRDFVALTVGEFGSDAAFLDSFRRQINVTSSSVVVVVVVFVVVDVLFVLSTLFFLFSLCTCI